MAKRQCKGTTKKGRPCKSPPLKGTDFCLSHSGADTRRKVQFVGGQPGSGRPRLPTPSEVARKLIEENIVVILRPHFHALGYDVEVTGQGIGLVKLDGGGAKLYGESRDGVVRASDFEDLGAQIAAADKLWDRIYGRPKQSTEVTGPDGGPIEHDHVGIPTSQDFQSGVAAVLATAGANGNGNGSS